MAVTETTPYVSYVQDSAQQNHPIAAPYLVLNHTAETPTYVSADNISGGIKYVVGSVPATLTEDMVGTIYLVADSSDVEGGSYIEYLVFKDGNTIKSEPIGTTKINVGVSSVSTAKDTVTVSYDKADAATGSAGGATVNGSNFTFVGTTATISVPKHSHTLGGTTKYLANVTDIPKTFSTTSVITSLSTTTVVSAGSATNVVTGYASPSAATVVVSVSGTTTRYKTSDVSVVGGTATVATAGTALTVAKEGITGYASPTKAGMATTSITYNTDAIKSYPGAFAAMATTSIRPAANITPIVSITAYKDLMSNYVGSTVMNSATVSSDGVLSFASTAVGTTQVVTSITTLAEPARAAAVTVATGGTTTGTQIMTGLGTAVAATKATTTVATGATATGTQFLTGLGSATSAATASITPVGGTTTVATKAASNVTVITNGTTNSGGVAVLTGVSGTTSTALTGLGTASTVSVAKAGSEVTVVTGAKGTADAYTGIASTVTAVTITSTASGNQAFIASLNANTGEKAAESISYQPAGTIGGSQSISAHTHSIGSTATSATVNVTGHTHTVTLSGGQVNN